LADDVTAEPTPDPPVESTPESTSGVGEDAEAVREALTEQLEASGITVVRDEADLAPEGDEPPVVARLVVEIRSDGTRTIARGAMEERTLGQRVAIEAKAGTPQELTAMLLKSLVGTPALTGKAVKDLLLAKGRGLRQRLKRRLLPGPGDD
jgi:hypothetical protein